MEQIEENEGESSEEIENQSKNQNNIKKIDDKFIEKINLIGDKTKKTNEYYYQSLKYAGKKFIINYSKKAAAKYNNIYYYCQLHRTTKFSNIFKQNNTKRKINLCNAKILYKKRYPGIFYL